MSDVKVITTEPGFITIDTGSGPPRRIAIANLLRQPDIPTGLTHTQVDGIRLLANMVTILIRVLQRAKILNEDFSDDAGMEWDLDHIIYAIEQLGGSYAEPDLDHIEDA